MRFLHVGISSLLLVSLAGCSAIDTDRRIDYGGGAKQLPNLEVPPDLTAPGSDDRYKLPQGEGGSVATFSDYSKRGDAQGGVASPVLPEVQGVRLERSGAQRWLVVRDSAENVWPVVRGFLLELGLTITSEEQAAGVIETDWAENRAKIPKSTIRNVMGKVIDKAYSSGERDQYLVRLERSKTGVGTEVYITHRGMAEVSCAVGATAPKWQMRPNDPELEAIMLQRLMVRFGASEDQAASVVAKTGAVAAAEQAAVTGVSEPAGTASLRETPSGVIIVMNDAFDRAWRKVGLAIESAGGLAVEDKNREKGIYFLRPVKVEGGWLDSLKFWKSSEDTEHQYRVIVKDGGALCEVSVTDQNGASSAVTKQMTEAIYKHINQ